MSQFDDDPTQSSMGPRGPREAAIKERKSETIAFRLTPDLHKALKAYLDDHPRESQTGLIIDLMERELVRLEYLKRQKPEPDLFSLEPGSREAVAFVAKELDALTGRIESLRRQLETK